MKLSQRQLFPKNFFTNYVKPVQFIFHTLALPVTDVSGFGILLQKETGTINALAWLSNQKQNLSIFLQEMKSIPYKNALFVKQKVFLLLAIIIFINIDGTLLQQQRRLCFMKPDNFCYKALASIS